MDPGVIRSRRSAEANDSLLGATRSPWTFSPLLVFPENVKTGMVLFSSLLSFLFQSKPLDYQQLRTAGALVSGRL
jgi:hypothetical protein